MTQLPTLSRYSVGSLFFHAFVGKPQTNRQYKYRAEPQTKDNIKYDVAPQKEDIINFAVYFAVHCLLRVLFKTLNSFIGKISMVRENSCEHFINFKKKGVFMTTKEIKLKKKINRLEAIEANAECSQLSKECVDLKEENKSLRDEVAAAKIAASTFKTQLESSYHYNDTAKAELLTDYIHELFNDIIFITPSSTISVNIKDYISSLFDSIEKKINEKYYEI